MIAKWRKAKHLTHYNGEMRPVVCIVSDAVPGLFVFDTRELGGIIPNYDIIHIHTGKRVIGQFGKRKQACACAVKIADLVDWQHPDPDVLMRDANNRFQVRDAVWAAKGEVLQGKD